MSVCMNFFICSATSIVERVCVLKNVSLCLLCVYHFVVCVAVYVILCVCVYLLYICSSLCRINPHFFIDGKNKE